MRFVGLTPSSLIDYPGKLSCVLFTCGCPFDCFYCHNRIALAGDAVSLATEDVIVFLERRVGLLEGVVISGGEPTLQQDLPSFLFHVRQMGYAVKLDTNGCSPSVLEEILALGLVDHVALDVKAPWFRYVEICGAGAHAQDVQRCLSLLVESFVTWEIRTTVAPTLSYEDMFLIAEQMPIVPAWRWNPYRIPSGYRIEDECRVKTPCAALPEMETWRNSLLSLQPNIIALD